MPIGRHGQPILSKVDGPRNRQPRKIDDGDAVAGPLTRAIVADDGPLAIVGRRDLVRCFARRERGKHASRRRVDDRCRVVAHVARDDGAVWRVGARGAERRYERECE